MIACCFVRKLRQAWPDDVVDRTPTTLTLANPRPFSTGLPFGFGDLFSPTSDGRFLLIEVKTPKGRASKEQLACIAAVLKAGGRASIAGAVADARAMLGQP